MTKLVEILYPKGPLWCFAIFNRGKWSRLTIPHSFQLIHTSCMLLAALRLAHLFSCGSYSDLHHLEWKVFLQANLVAVCDTNLVYLIIKSNCRSGNMVCKINHLIIIFLSFVKLPCSWWGKIFGSCQWLQDNLQVSFVISWYQTQCKQWLVELWFELDMYYTKWSCILFQTLENSEWFFNNLQVATTIHFLQASC